MKNSDFIRKVIYCKDCIHRYSENCPMYISIIIDYQTRETKTFDNSDNMMFCSEGEKYD